MLGRTGHTAAAVYVARLAGLNPSGVICEIMNEDGTMARLPDLVKFAQTHGLKVATIRDLEDVSEFDRLEIQHFFETYKDLEPGKSVEGAHWTGRTEAEAEIEASRKRLAASDTHHHSH